VLYVGIDNKAADADDRAIVHIEATLEDFVETDDGMRIMRSEGGGLRNYVYRVTFAGGTFIIGMSLNQDGKIAGMNTEEE